MCECINEWMYEGTNAGLPDYMNVQAHECILC